LLGQSASLNDPGDHFLHCNIRLVGYLLSYARSICFYDQLQRLWGIVSTAAAMIFSSPPLSSFRPTVLIEKVARVSAAMSMIP
jgi:hypothetical protein